MEEEVARVGFGGLRSRRSLTHAHQPSRSSICTGRIAGRVERLAEQQEALGVPGARVQVSFCALAAILERRPVPRSRPSSLRPWSTRASGLRLMTAEFLSACEHWSRRTGPWLPEARLPGSSRGSGSGATPSQGRERAQALDPEPVARGLTRITLSEDWPPNLDQMKALEKAFGRAGSAAGCSAISIAAESTPVLEDGLAWLGGLVSAAGRQHQRPHRHPVRRSTFAPMSRPVSRRSDWP